MIYIKYYASQGHTVSICPGCLARVKKPYKTNYYVINICPNCEISLKVIPISNKEKISNINKIVKFVKSRQIVGRETTTPLNYRQLRVGLNRILS